MAVNKVAMTVMYRKNENGKSTAFEKYFAEVDQAQTLTTAGFIEHIKHHNCAVGTEAIKAVIEKIAECVPELVAQGVPVRIDGLGTFYPTIENVRMGATEAQMKDKTFNPTSLIKGVHLRFRPDGTDLNNLTSKSYLTRSVSPTAEYIVKTEERTVDGQKRKVQVRTTLEDFRNPADAVNP